MRHVLLAMVLASAQCVGHSVVRVSGKSHDGTHCNSLCRESGELLRGAAAVESRSSDLLVYIQEEPVR